MCSCPLINHLVAWEGAPKVPTATHVTKGDRAFAVQAPRLWNALPEKIRLTDSLSQFTSLLKTCDVCAFSFC